MQRHVEKISFGPGIHPKITMEEDKGAAQMDGTPFYCNYSICLIWQEYKQKQKRPVSSVDRTMRFVGSWLWTFCLSGSQTLILHTDKWVEGLSWSSVRKVENWKRTSGIFPPGGKKKNKKLRELFQRWICVERRSRAVKLREICWMKVNEVGLDGEGYTRREREREQGLFLSR